MSRHVRICTAGAETTMIDETTLALVADASRANLFRVEVATGQWTPLEALGHPEGRMHDRDLKEDRRVENAGTKHEPFIRTQQMVCVVRLGKIRPRRET